jgi:hypothetical protein
MSSTSAPPALKRKQDPQIEELTCDEVYDDDKIDAASEPLAKRARMEAEMAEIDAMSKALEVRKAKAQEQRMVVAAGEKSLVVTPSLKPVVDDLFTDGDEISGPVVDSDGKEFSPFARHVSSLYLLNLPLLKKGLARVKNPDLAMALACNYYNTGMSMMDLTNKDTQFLIKQKADGQATYINFERKNGQRDFNGKGGTMGYNVVTPAFSPMYLFKYGPTKETGVEGNNGRIMKTKNGDVEIKPDEAHYDCTMGSNPIHPAMKDENGNNPMALMFLEQVQAVQVWAFGKMWCNMATTLVGARAILEDLVKRKKLDSMPTTGEEAIRVLKEERIYLEKIVSSETDSTSKSLSTSASCFRTPRKESPYGPAEDLEQLQRELPKLPMFQDNFMVTKKGQIKYNACHELPVWRYRRPDEVEEGKKYRSHLIPIPRANVRLTKDDVLYEVWSFHFYEFSAKKETAYSNHLVGFVWLNTKEELERLQLEELEPCDPCKANPFAGYYKGPLGWEGKPPPTEAAASDEITDEELFKVAEQSGF